MRKTLFLSSALLLTAIGCSGGPDSANNSSATTVTTNSSNSATNTSSVNNTPASAAANNDSSNVASNNAPSSSTTGGGTGTTNPDRIYQLSTLKTTTIKAPIGELKLWIMDDEPKRREGMMFLVDREVKDNEGMIFLVPKVQEQKGNYAFWMHNTILPLDIDYIGKDKKIINIGRGKPMNDDPVRPQGDYFYVIELKAGMSEKFGLHPGSKVEIPSDLKGLP